MKDKCLALISLILVMSICSCACSNRRSRERDDSDEIDATKIVDDSAETEEAVEVIYPDEAQIQYICNLATMDCYYHNVARGVVGPGNGIQHWGEEETPFWVEYDATVTIGIESNRVLMEMRDNVIHIYMPQATILGGVDIDPDSISSPVYRPHDPWRNDVEISSEAVTEAMSDAEQVVIDEIMNDPALLNAARQQAVDIIRGYIDQLESLSGVHYEVEITNIG